MGMTIEHAKKLLAVIVASISEDDDCFTIEDENVQVFKSALLVLLEAVEAIPKADYENRLKADLVAMLTDFLMDIEENTSINSDDSHERNGKRLMRTEIIGMFEQKINKLKENNDV